MPNLYKMLHNSIGFIYRLH